MISFENAVASLLKAGANKESDLVVKNVTITPCDKYTRIALTLDREVDGATLVDDQWQLGKTRVIFVSLFSIVSLFRELTDTTCIANHVRDCPSTLNVLLNCAKLDIVQQHVAAHATYTNAWTGEEAEHDSDHDSVFSHIVAIEFSDKAKRAIERIEDAMLGL